MTTSARSIWRGSLDAADLAPARKPSGKEIRDWTAEKHGLKPSDLTGDCRRRKIAYARFEAMWEIKRQTKLSSIQIGNLFGGRDHSTVLNAIRRWEEISGVKLPANVA